MEALRQEWGEPYGAGGGPRVRPYDSNVCQSTWTIIQRPSYFAIWR